MWPGWHRNLPSTSEGRNNRIGHTIDMSGFATVGDGGHLSSGSGSFSATRRAERRERRERERRRKGAAASDEAFGGDDVALALSLIHISEPTRPY